MAESVELVPLVDQERAAALLGGLSPRTLERWRAAGIGPRYIRCGRRVFYRPSDLGDFIERHARTSTRQGR